ncbi:hypothetical protein GN244_ATG06142 [Phytophthora infestans]|uniref:Uncharacterized protein n=1 Tax=Phytophthora infestans TaxID=4787 RepID=A0A833W446_PHYIN|nr:hypothetical protein GN244_ATG06142 [Phytophthora infestans]KAF4146770.1 hypothetical protein GN958_ATG04024 [Phytophthora infestans]
MSNDNVSVFSFLIPRWLRRKKSPPSAETIGNIFERRMKKRLKKQRKKPQREKHARARAASDGFKTFDLLAARDGRVHKPNREQGPQMLSWDSIADTYLSLPSPVGADAGAILGTTHTKNPSDEDPDSGRYTALLTRHEFSHEAAFRLHELAHLDMDNSTPSFVYRVPRHSARKWSMTTTQGSVH